MSRFLSLFFVVPLGILLVTLAVINRHDVAFALNPFRPEDPTTALVLPFYVYLLFAVLLGVLLGGFAVWLGQGRWRRAARSRSDEVQHWQAEADRLVRERDEHISRSKELVSLSH